VKPRRLGLFALVVACAGCAVGPDYHRPPAPTETRYTPDRVQETSVADGKSQRFGEGQRVPSNWWQFLRSRSLDAIVARAIEANPGLDVQRATLRQAQDDMRAGYGIFFPQVDMHAGVARQRYNPAPGAIAIPSNTFTLYSLSGSVSYVVDIWGGGRRQVEALRAAADAQAYAVAASYVMLTSNVVDTVIAQAAYQAEIEATRGTLVLLHEQVRIAEAQATGGTVPYANVLSLESQTASVEATVPVLEDKIDQASDLLAALTGAAPSSWRQPPVALNDLVLPLDVPVEVPSLLVRRRPDILVAEAEVHAANAEIGVATAAMLPNLTLSASYGVNNTSPGDLFAASSPVWNLGAGLTQPIFHGGTLYYQRRAAIDARDAALAQYKQTVLAAFEQVADTLRGLGHDADALKAQTQAVETAEKALRLIQANYQAGIATYLQLLIADGQYLQAKTSYIEAVAQRLQDTVALFVALGGGWSRD
jgi:NodT family efflux transporter outer membrane factor (OMF) lipoprotein